MATCPSCGTSSRTDPNAMSVEKVMKVKELGTFSISGTQMKAPAVITLRMSCVCGWSIEGWIEGDEFVGVPATQRFPETRE